MVREAPPTMIDPPRDTIPVTSRSADVAQQHAWIVK
jgi:hypothetical protein